MEIPDVKTSKNLTRQMLDFTAYTIKLVDAHKIHEAIKCINIVETLWQASEQKIRNIIDNIFVHSVSSHLEVSGDLPLYLNPAASPNLYAAYRRQVDSCCM